MPRQLVGNVRGRRFCLTQNKAPSSESAFIRLKRNRLFLRQYPFDQRTGFGFGHLRVGRHRYRAPDAAAALHHLMDQLVFRIFLTGIFCGDILERRTDHLARYGMASHAILCFRQIGHSPSRHSKPATPTPDKPIRNVSLLSPKECWSHFTLIKRGSLPS